MDDFLSTVDVGKLAGVGPTAVKRWADQGLLRCMKTVGGHRRFARDEVVRFLDELRGSSASAFVDLLLATDGLGVEARLLMERSRLGSWLSVAEMLGSALVEMGERWRAGKVSIIQEHLASERLSRALARVSDAMPLASDAPRCLLACAEGDRHTLGLALVELALREAGWFTLWAGEDTPADQIAEAVGGGDVHLVGVSTSVANVDTEGLRRQAERIGEACRAAGVALGLGGAGAWPDPPPYGERFRGIRPFVERARVVADARERG